MKEQVMNGRMDWMKNGWFRMYLFELERNSHEQIEPYLL